MSGLRERLLAERPYKSRYAEGERIGYRAGVDAALAAVREALLSDEAVEAGVTAGTERWNGVGLITPEGSMRAALAAALDAIDNQEDEG